jgi:hypothetical protein
MTRYGTVLKAAILDGLSIEAYLGFKEFTNPNTNTNT